jgi:hypothetical protein
MRNTQTNVKAAGANTWLGEDEKYAMLGLNLKCDHA